PDRVELPAVENALPWRHLVLAVRDRVFEPRALVLAQLAQVEGLAGVYQIRSVAGLAIVVVDRLARFHRLLVLARCSLDGQQAGTARNPRNDNRPHPCPPYSRVS